MENNFRIILAIKNKTISDVHKDTKISRSTLTDLYYCNSNNPKIRTIMKIADYLDVTIDDLFNESLIPSV